ncbi:MAG: hypothetical protein ACKOCN_02970 [Planctomycetaceae bacterium]
MSHHTSSGRKQVSARTGGAARGGIGTRTVAVVGVVVLAVVGGLAYLRPSRSSRIASETIQLQEQLLANVSERSVSDGRVEQIMRNVDQLQPDEIRRVREALFERLKQMREESLSRFTDALPVERTALIDGDLERIQLARAILDATDQGGMRAFTEAELTEREERQRQRESEGRKGAAPPSRPAQQPESKTQTDEQKRVAVYFEALTKRAREKKVELGRMFGRPPGRG